MHYRASRNTRCTILACASAAFLMIACGGDQSDSSAQAVACTTPTDSIIGGALEEFIGSRPIITVRYLTPIGTDSVVPEAAQYPFQANGRVLYMRPPDSTLQVKQRDQLRAQGASPILIVSYHGIQDEPDGRKSVQFSGSYIDVANDGQTIPRTKIYFDCAGMGDDRFTAADAMPSTPPAAAESGKAAGG